MDIEMLRYQKIIIQKLKSYLKKNKIIIARM